MKLNVSRPKQCNDIARKYKLYADDVQVAILKRGTTQIVDIPDSTEFIQAKIDWCSSTKMKVCDLKTNSIIVKNTFAHNIFTALFFASYYAILATDKYLTIENDIDQDL